MSETQHASDEYVTTLYVYIEKYSEKSFVVRGKTFKYKDKLIEVGGKWNPNLKGGKGWIFPLTKLEEVKKVVDAINDNLKEIKAQ